VEAQLSKNEDPSLLGHDQESRRKLNPVFKKTVHRITRPLHVGSSEVELAVDRGNLSARRRNSPIAEFELELKHGRPTDLFRWPAIASPESASNSI
jgi:inorganic triphosphatase YgiF